MVGFYAGDAFDPDLEVVAYVPLARDWARGDRAARCFLRDPRADFVGDVRDR